MINRITDELLLAAGRRQEGGNSLRQAPEEQGIGKQVKEWATEVENVIESHPGASLATALVAGILLGWWVKRL